MTSKKVLKKARGQAMQALGLMSSEEADALIGSPQPEEYGTLVRGVQGTYQMLWIMALSNGMRKTDATEKMGANALVILLSLIHYAYALGVRHGREGR